MPSSKRLHVLMLPDYRADNPYQSLLVGGLEQEGVTVEFPKGYRRLLPITRAVMDCQKKPDILHLHWLRPYARDSNLASAFLYRAKMLLDLSLVRLLGPRLVWTIHNLKPHESKWPRLDHWLRRVLLRLTDKAIVHSHGAQVEVCREYGCSSNKLAVIPHGHYRDFYGPPIDRSRARELLGLPQDKRAILFFGMIRPYKGVESLLETWGALHGDAMLLIAGRPADESMRDEIVKLGTQPNVRLMLRRIEDEEIPVLFSAADIAVFPFADVLTSGSVALAMSYDLPVIAPRLPGIVEILSGADELFYDPGDVHGLGQAIDKADGMELQPLREETRKACDSLSWDVIAQAALNCYFAVKEQT